METNTTLNQGEEDARAEKLVAEMEKLGGKVRAARASVGSVIFGQLDVVDESLVTLLAGGHALLVGVPGLAKTRLVEPWVKCSDLANAGYGLRRILCRQSARKY